jgi:hypothetical protein
VLQRRETVFSRSSEKYMNLAATKTELARLQMEILARESEENKVRRDEQHQLDRELKEADLKIKATQLAIEEEKLQILKKQSSNK